MRPVVAEVGEAARLLVVYHHPVRVGGGGGPEPGAGDRLDIIEAQGDGSSLGSGEVTTEGRRQFRYIYYLSLIPTPDLDIMCT